MSPFRDGVFPPEPVVPEMREADEWDNTRLLTELETRIEEYADAAEEASSNHPDADIDAGYHRKQILEQEFKVINAILAGRLGLDAEKKLVDARTALQKLAQKGK